MMSIACHTRRFVPSDGPALYAAHRAAIYAAPAYSPEQRESWAAGLRVEGYEEVFREREQCVVGLVGETVVGFCAFKRGEICGLYVHPDHQGIGMGTHLLTEAEGLLYQAGSDRVVVKASLNAASFYERSGFVEVGREDVVTRGGLSIETVMMHKHLSPAPHQR